MLMWVCDNCKKPTPHQFLSVRDSSEDIIVECEKCGWNYIPSTEDIQKMQKGGSAVEIEEGGIFFKWEE